MKLLNTLSELEEAVQSDPEQKLMQYRDNKGNTWLHIAVIYNRHDLIPKLIAKGLNIHASNYKIDTPLTLALIYRHDLCLEEILKQNAVQPPNDNDAIHYHNFYEYLIFEPFSKSYLAPTSHFHDISIGSQYKHSVEPCMAVLKKFQCEPLLEKQIKNYIWTILAELLWKCTLYDTPSREYSSDARETDRKKNIEYFENWLTLISSDTFDHSPNPAEFPAIYKREYDPDKSTKELFSEYQDKFQNRYYRAGEKCTFHDLSFISTRDQLSLLEPYTNLVLWEKPKEINEKLVKVIDDLIIADIKSRLFTFQEPYSSLLGRCLFHLDKKKAILQEPKNRKILDDFFQVFALCHYYKFYDSHSPEINNSNRDEKFKEMVTQIYTTSSLFCTPTQLSEIYSDISSNATFSPHIGGLFAPPAEDATNAADETHEAEIQKSETPHVRFALN